uniref:Uncharacterized protein n=1 Tax=Grammatophora oceanica TaxID=210454 RepID=A0A7S1V144_9STRA
MGGPLSTESISLVTLSDPPILAFNFSQARGSMRAIRVEGREGLHRWDRSFAGGTACPYPISITGRSILSRSSIFYRMNKLMNIRWWNDAFHSSMSSVSVVPSLIITVWFYLASKLASSGFKRNRRSRSFSCPCNCSKAVGALRRVVMVARNAAEGSQCMGYVFRRGKTKSLRRDIRKQD